MKIPTPRFGFPRGVVDCCYCGKIIDPDNEPTPEHSQNALVFNRINKFCCSSCCEENTRKCKHCRSNWPINKINKHGICPTCNHEAARAIIKNYSFKVQDYFGMMGKPLDGIHYGIEIEFESENHNEDTLIISELTKHFCSLKKDASIEQGFEVVSTPCCIKTHYEIWNDFFNNIPATTKPLKTCGMHIHASRGGMSDLQLGKMLVFLHNPENNKFIQLIAGRPSGFHNDYTVPKKISDGKNGGLLPQNADRHTALNLNGENTIEFRIFRSTKNKEEFLKNLEFCRALIKFTGWSVVSVKEARDYRNFIQFIFSNKADYPYLVSYLRKKSSFYGIEIVDNSKKAAIITSCH
jgi:hypothetical protein